MDFFSLLGLGGLFGEEPLVGLILQVVFAVLSLVLFFV